MAFRAKAGDVIVALTSDQLDSVLAALDAQKHNTLHALAHNPAANADAQPYLSPAPWCSCGPTRATLPRG